MVIKEFLPNPVGKDTDGEYIALLNNDKTSVDLKGWKLKDAGGKAYTLTSYALSPTSDVKLSYHETKLSLGNNGEVISLFDPAGNLIDTLSYTGTAVEGRIIEKFTELTPEVREKYFTNLPESYPSTALGTNPSEAFAYIQQSPLVLILLTGAILASISVWIIRQLKTDNPNVESERHYDLS